MDIIFKKRSNIVQTSFMLFNKRINDVNTVLLDTGAFISVWTKLLNDLVQNFRCRDTGVLISVSGLDIRISEICNIYAADI